MPRILSILLLAFAVAARAAYGQSEAALGRIEQENRATRLAQGEVAAQHEAAQAELRQLRDRAVETERSLAADRQRAKLSLAAGGPVSAVLLRHRAELGSTRDSARELLHAQQASARADLQRVETADEIAELRDPEAAAQELLRSLSGNGAAGALDPGAVSQVAEALLVRRKEYLEPLEAGQVALASTLAQIETERAALNAVLREYRLFVDAQVVWLPNDAPLGAADIGRAGEELAQLVARAYWQDVLAGVRSSLREFPLTWLAYTGVVGVLVVGRPRFRRRLLEVSQKVGSHTDRFMHTVRGLFLTVLLALPLPVALHLYSALLQASSGVGESCTAFAAAMDSISDLVLMCALLMEISCAGGLAELHFKWPPSTLASLRGGTRMVFNLALPLLWLGDLASPAGGAPSALGRICLVLALAILGAVSARMMRPSTGLFADAIARNPRGWLSTLRGIWYPCLVAVPFLLAVGAAAGYVFTTRVILANMVETYWVILGIALGLAMLERLFQSTSERFAWRRGTSTAEQRRLGDQVTRVIRLTTIFLVVIGLAAAWSDVIPALGLMRSVTLWTVGGGEGSPLKEVTLRDLLVCVMVVVLAAQLVRDLPGVLGLALLQRFPLDDSARYAIVSLGRYVLVLAGMVAACAALKIGWSNIQWLAAAVTVGLGFGLQEIFANFVSGLIMLAERPVRIGDVVTVDTVTGRAVKIATRATTLVDADGKEMIIPNKQFITGRIVNWTLDDGPVRFGLVVGVEYGTDLRLATDLLVKAVSNLPLTAKDEPPGVILRDFGESAVNFEIFYFVAHPRDNGPTRHELMIRIDELFRQHGIAIAFPQLDVRIRSGAVG